jgi:phosphohistidine phosphatase
VELFLVRHAIAEPRSTERWPDDSQRPLTENGIKLFRRAARGLRSFGIEVDAVLSSRHVRAWETAELLHDEAEWPEPTACEALEPGASPAAALAAAEEHDASVVALVGHEPQLSMLASLALASRSDAMSVELKKGGVVCLRVTSELTPGTALLRWSAQPKMLRKLGR